MTPLQLVNTGKISTRLSDNRSGSSFGKTLPPKVAPLSISQTQSKGFPFLGGGLAGTLEANFGDGRAGLFVIPPKQDFSNKVQRAVRPPLFAPVGEQIFDFGRGIVAGATNLGKDLFNLEQLGGSLFANVVDPEDEGERKLGRDPIIFPTVPTSTGVLEEGLFDVPFALLEGRKVLGEQGTLAQKGQQATDLFNENPAFNLGAGAFDIGSLFIGGGLFRSGKTVTVSSKIASTARTTKSATKTAQKIIRNPNEKRFQDFKLQGEGRTIDDPTTSPFGTKTGYAKQAESYSKGWARKNKTTAISSR